MTTTTISTIAVAASLHERVDEDLDQAAQAWAEGRYRDAGNAYDRVVATLSAHLLAVEVAVGPRYTRRTGDAGLMVHRLMAHSRRVQAQLRVLQRLRWGRTAPDGLTIPEVHAKLVRLLDLYRTEESRMLRTLDDVLTEQERAELRERLDSARGHAPDRPHPHAWRSLAATRLLYRPVAVWDGFWDALDSHPKRIPARTDRTHPLWDAYWRAEPAPEPAPEPDGDG